MREEEMSEEQKQRIINGIDAIDANGGVLFPLEAPNVVIMSRKSYEDFCAQINAWEGIKATVRSIFEIQAAGWIFRDLK